MVKAAAGEDVHQAAMAKVQEVLQAILEETQAGLPNPGAERHAVMAEEHITAGVQQSLIDPETQFVESTQCSLV